MESYKDVLNKVGIVLIIVGLIDIACMVYSINNELNYSSSLNIFAVIAGIFLVRGSIRTARYVTFFTAFMLIAFIGALIAMPIMMPLDLMLTEYSIDPVSSTFPFLLMFAVVYLFFWVYRQLTQESVMAARKSAGLSYTLPKIAFALGGLLAIGAFVGMFLLNNSDSSKIAKNKAKEKYGEEYKYHVKHLSFSGNRVYARLTAYNDLEIRVVEVRWEE